jgi:hypothetical protein
MLFCLLLFKHFCDFKEEFVDALASLGRDGVVGHLVFLDQLFQLLLLEVAEWEGWYRYRSLLFPQMIDNARSFLFSRNREIHCSRFPRETGAKCLGQYLRYRRPGRSRQHP